MARVTATQVLNILDYAPVVGDIAPYINAANELVTEMCAPQPYTPSRHAQIELWLAAHFVTIRDARIQSEQLGEQMVSYQQTGLNLQQTAYGQQAMMLDTLGGLAYIANHPAQGKRAKAGIVWLGTPQCPTQLPRSWLYLEVLQ